VIWGEGKGLALVMKFLVLIRVELKSANLGLGDQHLVIYRKGQIPLCDIMEFDFVEIDDTNKPCLNIGAMSPKISRKPKDGGLPYIEWDKETIFRAKQILEVKKLKQPIGTDDVGLYDGILAKAEKFVEKYRSDAVK